MVTLSIAASAGRHGQLRRGRSAMRRSRTSSWITNGDNGAVEIGEARFDELVADALDSLPPRLGELMDNVAVIVEDLPTAEQQAGQAGTLLGLYEGVALTRRSPLSYSGTMPDRITIFRRPITRLARTETELVKLVTTTVIHEVAHHFGISDTRLQELGWT
jgi:predicted Zn-dependent protease with MMP-like domain